MRVSSGGFSSARSRPPTHLEFRTKKPLPKRGFLYCRCWKDNPLTSVPEPWPSHRSLPEARGRCFIVTLGLLSSTINAPRQPDHLGLLRACESSRLPRKLHDVRPCQFFATLPWPASARAPPRKKAPGYLHCTWPRDLRLRRPRRLHRPRPWKPRNRTGDTRSSPATFPVSLRTVTLPR